MTQFVFGAGQLFVAPQGYDNQAFAPLQVADLQGVTVDFSFSAKALNSAAGSWPLAIGRGTGKIPCKADFARFSAGSFNALFFGGADPGTGMTRTAVDEAHTVTACAATATSAGNFTLDLGVTRATDGQIYTRVAATPAGLQYVGDDAGGYQFNSSQNNVSVLLSYTYNAPNSGRRLTLGPRNMGFTPRFSVVLTELFNGKRFTLTLPVCSANKLTLTSKQQDFSIPGFGFFANADDSRSIGTISIENDLPGATTPSTGDANTILLMHADAPLGGITLIDQCGNNGSIVENPTGPSGLSTVSANAPLVGAGSIFLAPYFTQSAYIVSALIPPSSRYALTGPFTIEFSHVPGYYRGAFGGNIFTSLASSGAPQNGDWYIDGMSDGHLRFVVVESNNPEAKALSATWPQGVRADIAATRDNAGYLNIFVNGVLRDTSLVPSFSPLRAVNTLILGGVRWQDGVNNFADGKYDEIRISNICRYTADYTPAFPFPNPA